MQHQAVQLCPRLVASTAVAVVAFDSVGAILVVAFFVVPAAAAHLLATRLATMLILAVAVGWASAVAGHWAAVHYDTSISGTIGLATVVCFVLARLLAPRRGLLWRGWRRQVGADRFTARCHDV